MNVENMRKVAALLRETETYNQSRWETRCGAPACVAGHAAFLTLDGETEEFLEAGGVWKPLDDDGEEYWVEDIADRAARFLGIVNPLVDQLFTDLPDFEWDAPFSALFREALSPEEEAAVAADYVDWLADEYEAQHAGA